MQTSAIFDDTNHSRGTGREILKIFWLDPDGVVVCLHWFESVSVILCVLQGFC